MWPGGSSPAQVMGMDSKRELAARGWTDTVGRPGQLMKKIIPRFLEQTLDGPTVRSGASSGAFDLEGSWRSSVR